MRPVVEETVTENFAQKPWSPKTIFNDGRWSRRGESLLFDKVIEGDVSAVDLTNEVEVAGIFFKLLARIFVDESPLSWIA